MATNAPEPSLLDGLKTECQRTAADLRQLALARWQLARLELVAAKTSVQRYGVSLAVAGVLVLVSLPVLVVALVDAMGTPLGLPRWFWLSVAGVLMLAGAGALAWLARRRFQYEFVGLEETMEEFREDMEWFKEWFGEQGKRDVGSSNLKSETTDSTL
jgi:uncharacterized membrane protein YqjE